MKVFLDALSRTPHMSIGSQTYIISDMQIIDKKFNGCEFVFLSSDPDTEAGYLKKTGLKYTIVKRADSQLATIKQVRKIVSSVDVIVSAWGDGYMSTPAYNIIKKSFFLKSRKKPLLLFPSSIGLFEPGLKTYLTKLGLQRFDYLGVRDKITYEGLRKIGLKNIYLVHDTAFVLKPAGDEIVNKILYDCKLDKDSEYIGFNISILLHHLFARYGKDYVKEMIDIITWIRDSYKLPVLLIPHQIYPVEYKYTEAEYQSKGGDDRYPIELIWKNLSNHSNIFRLTGEYSATELKGVIKRAEVFVGGRMHSVIGAISQAVPSLIMQYSHKAGGMMKYLNMEELVWDISETPLQFKSKFEYLWNNKNNIKERLSADMKSIYEEIYSLADEIKNRI